MEKRYVDSRQGQLHCRIHTPAVVTGPPLICLHALPYSGLHFARLAPLLAIRRRVICPDYPGYGASDAGADNPTVEDYARAMLACIEGLGLDGAVDLLGFHTGCLVGLEMALQAPGRVRRLVLIDVPCFTPARRKQYLAELGKPPRFTGELASIQAAWDTNVASKMDQLPVDRCLELLAEQLRIGPRANAGFRAAFSYDCERRLPQVTQPCRVLATGSSLAEASRAAARLLPAASWRAFPEIGPPVLDAGAAALAGASLDYLESIDDGLAGA
jgi:pimeloyl-ACP methyl ester carboxylesterase